MIVHPDQRTVLPLDFEPIVKSNGDKKNDCERNAAKRLLLAIHQLYSRQFVVLEDALAANGPHIQTLIGYGIDFIINIKPMGNAPLFETMHKHFLIGEVTEEEVKLDDGTGRGYRFAADLALNASHPDTRVNMIEYWEVDKNGEVTLDMSWITNLVITRENLYEIVRVARTRWKVGEVGDRARSYRLPASPRPYLRKAEGAAPSAYSPIDYGAQRDPVSERPQRGDVSRKLWHGSLVRGSSGDHALAKRLRLPRVRRY